MPGLAAAFWTAALALAGKVVFDLWSGYRARRGIAAALAGEIGAYVELIDPLKFIENMQTIAGMSREDRQSRFRALNKVPDSHPVFDKIADRIGILSADEALAVSKFYNVVTGFRLIFINLSSEGFIDAGDDVQTATLNFIVKAVKDHIKPADALVKQLKKTADQSILVYASDGVFPSKIGKLWEKE